MKESSVDTRYETGIWSTGSLEAEPRRHCIPNFRQEDSRSSFPRLAMGNGITETGKTEIGMQFGAKLLKGICVIVVGIK